MVKSLLRFKSIFILTAIVLLQYTQVSASHSMGADLTYECLGGNTYKLRLSFYRDCIGIAAPTNVYININSVSCGSSLGVTCYPIPGTGQEITPLCPSATSTCNGGVFTGIQEWVYEGVVTLPFQCTDWEFSYNLCCRNAAISTINTPGATNIYIYATLNNTLSPCDNSPTFTNKPVPFVCQGQQFCFNHGATDVDGDSLVYSLVPPKHDATTNVSYIAPYSQTNPLNSNPPMQFDPNTGDFCMTPQQLQVTVMAVLVKEYRNGVLIGSVVRDIQITVISCSNNLPTLSGINGTNNFSATICAGTPYCFNIFSDDPDNGQNLSVIWDGAITGNATFTASSAPHPVGTFCWTPTQADISGTAHCFTVLVHDDACPMFGSQIYSYCITVVGVNVNAGPDQFITCQDQATIYATASGGSGVYTYQWSNGSTAPAQTVGIGTYVVTVNDGMCTATDTVQIINAVEPTAAFTSTGQCVNSIIQFTDQSTVSGGVINSWTWNFGDASGSSLQNPIHYYNTPGTYNVQLIVTTSLGCIDTIIQPITIVPLPIASFTVQPACAGSAVSINNTSTPAGSISGWNWTFGNGTSSNNQNPSVSYPDSGNYTITLIAGDSLGCSDTATAQVTIYPVPVASFTYNAAGACQGGSVTLTNTSTGTIISYNWDLGNGQTSTAQDPVVTYSGPGTYTVTLTVTSDNGCTATVSQQVTIAPLPTANAGPDQTMCVGGNATLSASGGGTYQWNTGSTSDIITVSPSSSTTYTVTITDANGCTATDQVNVAVNPLPNITVSPDQSVCNGQSVTLSANGGTTYSWSPTGDNTQTISVTPGSSTTYAVTGTDANGCQSTAFVNVTVNPVPVVNLSNVFICPGTNTVLDAQNAGATYQWSNGATSQTITVTSAGTYTVTVTDANGCTASASSVVSQGGTLSNNTSTIAFCQGGSAVLDAGNPGNTYLWSNGATTQTITVNNAGTYSVIITDANGCSGTVITAVNVNVIPVADFTPHDVCINDATYFNDISSVTIGSITGWQWDFGDGNVSQQQNPVHTYAFPGNYTVNLTVTSDQGCTATNSSSFTVFPLPQANFSTMNVCTNDPVTFTSTSTTSVGNIIGWQWNFGDGNNSSQQNPVHAYGAPGTYDVTLLVTTAGGCKDSITKQVTIYNLPVAAFTADTVCLNSLTSFNDLSSVSGSGIQAWSWDFGDGTTSSVQDPTHTYSTPGTFNVQLITTSSYGCTDTISQPVLVRGLPVADAGADQSICEGLSATLNAAGGATYSWTPGGNTLSTITVTPAATTTYTVVITDAFGCTNSDDVTVNVKQLPVANAGPDAGLCTGSSTTLTASGGASYSWSPGGQSTASISVNPVSTTNYIVQVTAVNGCVAYDTVTVNVNALPVVNVGADQAICDGTTATLNATGGVSYQWNPTGDTASTIYVNPSVNTTYIVVVTDANGCVNADTMNITINPMPQINLSPAFICTGSNTILDAGNPGCSYLWSPNGETTQTILVGTAGNYSVLVTSPQGCIASGSTVVTVGGDSIATNVANIMICQGQSTTLDAGNPGLNYQWSTGATTQTINVTTAGIYAVTISDLNGCTATFSSTLTVSPLPSVSFGIIPSCINAPFQFNDSSAISSGNIVTWNWDFGDGSGISSLQNPTYQYSTTGNYTVTLTAISGNGCTASGSQSITVNPLPLVDFGSNAACVQNAVAFTDLSSVTSGNISFWNWSFGDGSNSSLQNPTHQYTAAGTYDVTLIAYTSNGCLDSITHSITVNPQPVAAFAATNVCNGLATQFTNNSTINNGFIDAYDWQFGDGANSQLQNPAHTYANAGTYNVTLTCTSDLGCSHVITIPVTVYPLPQANFTTPTVCLNIAAVFNDNSSVQSGSVNGWYWDFGDNSSANAEDTSHQYGAPGSYSVMLVVTSDQNCRDTAVQNITIAPMPVANYATQGVCQNNAMIFSDSSSVITGSISAYSWSFGDGSNSASQNPTHNYASAGTYDVMLVVTSDYGCSDSVMQSVNVFPLPQADFSSTDVCLGSPIAFFDQSGVSGGGTFTCTWDFGDGNADTVENPSHTYAAAGVYNVTLTVTTNSGCTGTIVKQVNVLDPPNARFSGDNVCLNNYTTFSDLSTTPSGIIVAWDWNFGDGSTSATKNPVHNYASPGMYVVTLRVTSSLGCDDLYSDSVRVFQLPAPVIAATVNCISDPVTFMDASDTTLTGTTSWNWIFGDGTSLTGSSSAIHQYTQAGTYTVIMEAVNADGCRSADTAIIDVHPAPDADFEGGPGCAGSDIQFTNTSTISSGSITGYVWSFGDSTNSTAANPVHNFSQPGTYNVMLIVTSDFGCVDTIIKQVIIYPLPTPAFVFDQAAGCGPLTIHFTDSSFIAMGNIVSWQWDFGDGTGDTVQNPVHTYYTSGSYNVTLTVTSDNGCSQTATIPNTITIYPSPEAMFTPDPQETNILQPVITFNNQTTGGIIYQWTLGDGGVSTEFEPVHAYHDTGTYNITLWTQNSFGCIDTASGWVHIGPIFTVYIPNTFTPNEDGRNEVFNLKGIGIIAVELDIWDRWGEHIYHGTDKGWDGSVKGSSTMAQQGVYIYQFRIKDVFKQEHAMNGRVNLIR